MALWGGRFAQGPAESVAALSRSVHFDWRLAPYDIRVNIAHLHGLTKSGVVSASDAQTIEGALVSLAADVQSGTFIFNDSDEDVHSAIERGLVAKIGPLGGAIRAGRSRNDLVVTDFKLYIIDHLLTVSNLVTQLIAALNAQAERHAPDPDEKKILEILQQALDGDLDYEARIQERIKNHRRYPGIIVPPPVVTTMNDLATDATILEVRMHDRPGLLYDLTKFISTCGVDIRAAIVATLGAEAFDTFYITETDGKALSLERATDLAAQIERQIRE